MRVSPHTAFHHCSSTQSNCNEMTALGRLAGFQKALFRGRGCDTVIRKMFKLVIFTPCCKIQETGTEANRFGPRCSMRFPFPQGFHSCSRPTAARPRRGYLRSEGSFPPAIDTRPAGSPDRGIPAAPSRCTLLQPQAAEVSARGGSVDDGIARQLLSLHAASRAAPKAQQVGPGDELGLARVRDALHRGVQRLAAPHEDDLLPSS